MTIRIEQPGAAKATAAAGVAIGKGKRAEEERARAEREQARVQQIAAQQSARQAALEWEQQKMLLNSQQDFAHEMRMRQAELDREARAQEWHGEKMELASRLDFEQDEKERIRRKATAMAGLESIDNSDAPEPEKANARFRLWQKFPEVSELTQYAGFDIVAERQALKPQKELTPGQLLSAQEKVEEIEERKPRWWRRDPDAPTEAQLQVQEYLQRQIDETLARQNITAIPGMTAEISSTVKEVAEQTPIYATNKATGERIVSIDGGNTWLPAK